MMWLVQVVLCFDLIQFLVKMFSGTEYILFQHLLWPCSILCFCCLLLWIKYLSLTFWNLCSLLLWWAFQAPPHLHEFPVCIWSQSTCSSLEWLNEGIQMRIPFSEHNCPTIRNCMGPEAFFKVYIENIPYPLLCYILCIKAKVVLKFLGWAGRLEGRFLSKLWRWVMQ